MVHPSIDLDCSLALRNLDRFPDHILYDKCQPVRVSSDLNVLVHHELLINHTDSKLLCIHSLHLDHVEYSLADVDTPTEWLEHLTFEKLVVCECLDKHLKDASPILDSTEYFVLALILTLTNQL